MRKFEYREVNGRRICITPNVQHLEPDEILVVPTNERGIHGAGLALLAKQRFGLKHGFGEGLCGQCYALPTKRRPHEGRSHVKITKSVVDLTIEVMFLREIFFIIPAVGTGLAGRSVAEMADLFYGISFLPNISLPIEFINHYVENPELFPH